jgi:hypothetical protein
MVECEGCQEEIGWYVKEKGYIKIADVKERIKEWANKYADEMQDEIKELLTGIGGEENQEDSNQHQSLGEAGSNIKEKG